MRRIAVLSAATLLTAIILAPSAQAQGFSVYEHDPCMMARGGAGVAAPCAGGSAVFFNPAGIDTEKGKPWNLEANLTLIAPRGNFVDSASRVKTEMVKNTFPVPAGYFTRQLGANAAVGIGAFAPYGLTSEWPTAFQGRYLGYKTQISSFYIQPTFAYRVANGFQIGAGVDFVTSSAKVHRRLDASALPIPGGPAGATLALLGVPLATDFADALFDVSGTGWGGHVGVMWQAASNLSFGIRYMSQVKIKFTGNASFTTVPTGITLAAGNPFGAPAGTALETALFAGGGTTLQNQSASTSITMPAQLVAGVAYGITPTLKVMADWQYTDWSVFKTLDLTLSTANYTLSEYEHYKATNAFRAGFDWQATDGLTIRAGALTHKGAAPDETVTPILPEGQRIEGTVGAGIRLTPALRLDLAYQYLYQGDRRGRMIEVATPTAANNHGIFAFTANLFGASLALAF